MKAKWIPAELIVELQSPAVSSASSSSATTKSGVPSTPDDGLVSAGEVLADDGLLC